MASSPAGCADRKTCRSMLLALAFTTLCGAMLAACGHAQTSSADTARSGGGDTAGTSTAGWREVCPLPFAARGAVAWRDTLYIGSRLKGPADSLTALLAVPLRTDGDSIQVRPILTPSGLRVRYADPVAPFDGALLVRGLVKGTEEKEQDRLFLYDGRWRPFPAAPPRELPPHVSIQVHDGQVYATGCFRGVPDDSLEAVLVWTGEEWRPQGLRWQGFCALLRLEASEGRLLAWSSRRDQELDEQWLRQDVDRYALAEWDGQRWTELARGQDGVLVRAVALHGTVYGAFSMGRPRSGLAAVMALGPDGWRPLGGPFGPDVPVGREEFVGPFIWDLAVHEGRLVVAGSFEHANGVVCRGLAIWDGAAWHDLGGAVAPPGDASRPSLTSAPGSRLDRCTLFPAHGSLWRLQDCPPQPPQHHFTGSLQRWEGSLPLDTPSVPYQAPPIYRPLPIERPPLPAFRNGDFNAWWRGVLEGWERGGGYWHGPPAAPQAVPGMRQVTRLPEGGVRLDGVGAGRGGIGMCQRFRIEPGRGYRVRALARAVRSAADTLAPRLTLYLGMKRESVPIDEPRFRWYDLTLPAPGQATVGAVCLWCPQSAGWLEVQRVLVEEATITFADCFSLLDADLRAHCDFRSGAEAAWDSLSAHFAPIVASAVNGEALQNIVEKALGSLQSPGFWSVSSEGDVTSLVCLSGGRESDPFTRPDHELEPGMRLLRLPCGFDVVYPERPDR